MTMPPSTEVRVRRRRAVDVPELARVLVRVHAVDGYPVEGVADPEEWLSPAGEIASWTAEYRSRAVGHISLVRATAEDDAARVWADATGGDIDDLAIPVRLFVDPDHRGLGAGRDLMLAAAGFAEAHGRSLAFDVMLKDTRAIELYEGLGCQRLGTITHHHSGGRTEPAAVYAAAVAGPG